MKKEGDGPKRIIRSPEKGERIAEQKKPPGRMTEPHHLHTSINLLYRHAESNGRFPEISVKPFRDVDREFLDCLEKSEFPISKGTWVDKANAASREDERVIKLRSAEDT